MPSTDGMTWLSSIDRVREGRHLGGAVALHRCVEPVERLLGDLGGDLGSEAAELVVLVDDRAPCRCARTAASIDGQSSGRIERRSSTAASMPSCASRLGSLDGEVGHRPVGDDGEVVAEAPQRGLADRDPVLAVRERTAWRGGRASSVRGPSPDRGLRSPTTAVPWRRPGSRAPRP